MENTASSTAVFRKLVTDFPCMVPNDTALSSYSGFLRVSGRQFRIVVASDCSQFDCDDSLKTLITASLPVVKGRLQTATDPHEFLIELRDVVERVICSTSETDLPIETSLPPAQFYERLLSEISHVGWDRVSSMDETMRCVELNFTDDAQRTHTISLMLPVDYPTSPPKCITGLPVDFDLQWARDASLQSLLQQFESTVAKHQDFFRAMEDIDQNAWVLEPEHPTMRETYRRLALGKHCSVRIELDPRMPIKGFPECRFLGSEAAIGPLKQRLNQSIHLWDMSGDTLPRQNLEKVLDMSLPCREVQEAGEEEDMSLECGICYAYRLEDCVPDVACDLAECAKPYHRNCLVEWLRALPDTRESFGTLTGNCVYCEHVISVSVKDG